MASNKQPNKDRLRMWVRALKSGQYQQGKNYMRTSDGKYCCLGVAMDLALANGCAVTGMEDWGKTSTLPALVADWFGIHVAARLRSPEKLSSVDAASLNDKGRSFPLIADQIVYTYGLDQDD